MTKTHHIDRSSTTLRPRPLTRRMTSVLALLAGLFLAQSGANAEPVFTSKGRFRIPYQLDEAEIQRLGATEIQLHVSTDNGRSWRHVDSVPPVEGKFTFDAANDGEYSFAVRTVDRNGNLHPAGPLTASLEVTVDTTAPVLEIEVQQADPGRVQVRWDASDAHLNSESLTLEHRDLTTGEWLPMSIEAADNGQTSWSVAGGGTVEVRGTIRDAAGNETTAEASGTIQQATPDAEEPAAPQIRQRRQPIADANSESSGATEISASPLPSINPEISAFSRPVSVAPTQKPPVTQPRWDGEQEAEETSQPTPTSPPADPHPVASNSSTAPLADGSVRRVSSLTFQIAYQVDEVGPSGVGSVDLYLTENGGEKWFHYGADLDRQSPFQVTLPDDGTYGFAIRVKSGVGLSAIPPQPHDPPELTIIVDRQPPLAKLMPVRPSEGGQNPKLVIEWEVTDDALPDKPVSLFYAAQPSGPWEPLSGWHANTGSYTWQVASNVPPQVYVRLEARDAAGNSTRVDSDGPIVIDLSKPKARFLEVEPIR